MLKANVIKLINEHRAACGRNPIEDHPDAESELKRIGEQAQYGEDPFSCEPDDTLVDQAGPATITASHFQKETA